MYLIYFDRFNNKSICTLDKTKWIPFEEANTDYQEYLKWVAQGNTAEEYNSEGV